MMPGQQQSNTSHGQYGTALSLRELLSPNFINAAGSASVQSKATTNKEKQKSPSKTYGESTDVDLKDKKQGKESQKVQFHSIGGAQALGRSQTSDKKAAYKLGSALSSFKEDH